MTVCPSCKKAISEKAEACPHCGHSFRLGFFGFIFGTIKIIFVIVAVVVAFLFAMALFSRC